MAGTSLTFTLSDLADMQAQLEAAHRRSEDFSPLMDQIGAAMETSTHERFEKEEAPDGTAWAETIRKKEEGGQILRLDGHLDNSVTHRAGADEVEIGSNLIYAGVHQDGATIWAKKDGYLRFALPGGLGFAMVDHVTIPARPYLGIGGDDEETIAELTADYLLGDLAA